MSYKFDKLAFEVCNHPDFLKCGQNGLKKLAKKIEKQLKKKSSSNKKKG